jgi:hypothetical protein
MNQNKQIKLGTVLSYCQVFVTIIVSILYTPIMIKFLGKSEYGLYNTVSSIISALSILSFRYAQLCCPSGGQGTEERVEENVFVFLLAVLLRQAA